MATTSSPVFPISLPHHFSDYGFDPQFDYFQVVEEARRQYHPRSIDTLHFKLHKTTKKMKSSKPKKRRWWKSALHFIKSRWPTNSSSSRPIGPTSISGPIYLTESYSGSSTPAWKGKGGNPYVSLRELNMEAPPMPIYLVT